MFNEIRILTLVGGGLYILIPIMENFCNKNDPSQINWRTLIILLFYCFLGWLAGYVYFDNIGITTTNKVMALHIGLSSPLIFRTMIDNIPKFVERANSQNG